jgi:hypothetical protein
VIQVNGKVRANVRTKVSSGNFHHIPFCVIYPPIFYGVPAGETSLFGPAEVATSHAMTAHEYYKRREG